MIVIWFEWIIYEVKQGVNLFNLNIFLIRVLFVANTRQMLKARVSIYVPAVWQYKGSPESLSQNNKQTRNSLTVVNQSIDCVPVEGCSSQFLTILGWKDFSMTIKLHLPVWTLDQVSAWHVLIEGAFDLSYSGIRIRVNVTKNTP